MYIWHLHRQEFMVETSSQHNTNHATSTMICVSLQHGKYLSSRKESSLYQNATTSAATNIVWGPEQHLQSSNEQSDTPQRGSNLISEALGPQRELSEHNNLCN